jgi:GTP-binding protein
LSIFVDEARCRVIAGNGGSGLIAFHREKYVPRGGPSGGDGGRGGDVVLLADRNLHTLLDFRYRREYRAERGQHGGGSGRTGRSGEDLVIRVPVGTEVRDAESGEILGDLVRDGDSFIVAHGGKGGRGNQHFATSTLQSPQFSEDGGIAEERDIVLTLKLLADVGLVGFPNAGKSTLLASLSAARPKVADYPFTTLEPYLGIVRVGEYGSFVLADIPGLIEGASRGKGLGIKFLRHLERTRVLLFLIDAVDPEPEKALATLRRELASHSELLAAKPFLVALSKADQLPEGESPPGLSRLPSEPYIISSHSKRGLEDLVRDLYRLVETELSEELGS